MSSVDPASQNAIEDSKLADVFLSNTVSDAIEAGQAIGDLNLSNTSAGVGSLAASEKTPAILEHYAEKVPNLVVSRTTSTSAVFAVTTPTATVVVAATESHTVSLSLKAAGEVRAKILAKVNVVKDLYDFEIGVIAAGMCTLQ